MCLMIALAALSSYLPGMAGSRMPGAGGAADLLLYSGRNMPAGADENPEIGGADAALRSRFAGMTQQEKEFYRQSSGAVDFVIQSEERGKSLAAKRGEAVRARERAVAAASRRLEEVKEHVILARFKLDENMDTVTWLVFGLPASLLAAGALCVFLGCFRAARIFGAASFGVMTCAVTASSLLMLGCQVFLGINGLRLVPPFLWVSGFAMILASAFFLRVVDINYPFWNRALRALAAPAVCAALAASWGRLHGLFISGG